MKTLTIIALLISLAAAGFAYQARTASGPAAVAAHETAFDRVMRTGVLRCGYYVFPPMLMRDPNTNAFSGLSVDMMNTIAEKTGLKIEWTEEVNFGTIAPALAAGRFDALCTPDWPDMALGRETIFTRPFIFAGVAPVVRADDHRFDQDETKLNDPAMTIVAQEGNLQVDLAKAAFPKAHILVMPANAEMATVVANVSLRKADAMMWDQNGISQFNAHNQDKLKMLDPNHPTKAQPFALPVYRTEFALREFLDNAVADLLATGTIDRLLTKWEPEPGTFLRVAEPYRAGN